MNSEAVTVELPKAWVKVDESPVVAANDFGLLAGPGKDSAGSPEEFVLVVGHSAAPVLLGDPEQVLEQAKGIEFVPIRTLARFSITPSSLKGLARLLSEMDPDTNT